MIFFIGHRPRGSREYRSMSAPIRSSPDNLIGTALRVLYGMRYSDTCPFAVRIALETRRSPERLLAASGRWNEAQLIRLGEHPRIGSPPLETLLQASALPRT